MIKVAIAEDEIEHRNKLKDYVSAFFFQNDIPFKLYEYLDGEQFLLNEEEDFDLVFLDINMPKVNGYDAAKRFREKHRDTILIFVTSLSQYAIKGYEVGAFGYILKPISYFDFSLMMNRLIDKLKEDKNQYVVLNTKNGMKKIPAHSILYIEVIKHQLIYHTFEGNFSTYRSLKETQEELSSQSFSLCNRCYLVNLKYAQEVDDFSLRLSNNEVLQISRPRKKEFIHDLNLYLSKGH